MTPWSLVELFKRLTVKTVAIVDEDAGWHDHLVGQITGPYYCGTAFCGHHTKRAARECWKKKCDRFDELQRSGKDPYLDSSLYPQRDPANWPINRSRSDLRAEYLERATREELAENDSESLFST